MPVLGGESPGQTSLRRRLPGHSCGGCFSGQSWQRRSRAVPGRGFLEGVLPHPVTPRAELVGEFRELQAGVTEERDCHVRDSRQKGKLLFLSIYYVLAALDPSKDPLISSSQPSW